MVEINGTLIFQIVNFFVLVLLLAKFAYKPLLTTMEERRQRIANDLAHAEEARKAADAAKEEYAIQLQEARREAQLLIEAATKQAEEESQAQIKELREQLAKEKELARQDIEREREKAMRQIREEVVTLSIAMASKIVAKDVSTMENQKLVEDAIAQLDSTTIRS